MALHPDGISDALAEWIREQRMFFVATAPSDVDGHVNVSPKGLDAFVVLGPDKVAYLDLTGSGIETIAHLRENGRITIMLCAFEGKPKICRLHGRGKVHSLGTAGFDELLGHFAPRAGMRSIIEVDVERVSTSCGFGVPLMEFRGERGDIDAWIERKGGEPGMVAYRAKRNAESIDGLPGWEGLEPDA